MRRIFRNRFSLHVLIAAVICMNFGFAYAGTFKEDTIYMHMKKAKSKNSYLKSGLPFSLPPLKPGLTSYVKINIPKADDKLLSDVEVFPNPIVDHQLTLKYSLSRNSNVSIKIMDVLGNDILTVFQQRVDLGEQKVTYSVSNKLSRGFYFVRIIAGPESVIKRISIL